MKHMMPYVALLLLWTSLATCTVTDCPNLVATFSIVGFDPETGELGIAVASKFLAVGAVVPHATAGVGAIATQAFANTSYGPEGLRLLDVGMDPHDVLEKLTSADAEKERRQVGIVGANGASATFTGKECIPWAGGKAGRYYACQGNILVCEATVDAMARAFETGEGELGVRLVKALKAGEEAGGDARGKQSAALLVVKEGGGYGGFNDRYMDLRVDDHPEPIDELERILSIQLAYSALYKAGSLRREGQMDGALEEAKRACRINPNLPEALYDLACYYSLLGEEGKAVETLERALKLEPGFKDMAKGDPDFEAIRGNERFKAMLEP
jgi:uncharacterized Ntn-hydrolase superfamily protein